MAKIKGVSQVPESRELNEFERATNSIGLEITNTLLSVDVLDYDLADGIRIKNKVEDLVKELNRVDVDYIKSMMPEAYQAALAVSYTRLEILGKKPDPNYNQDQHRKTVQDETLIALGYLFKANNTIKELTSTYLNLVNTVSRQLQLVQLQEFGGFDPEEQDYILGFIEDAVQEGGSRQGVASKIKAFIVDKIGEGNLLRINNRFYKVGPYSKMVARTEMRRLQSQGVLNACNQYGNDLVEVSDHGTETEICLPYEGQTYSISGNSIRFPALTAEPPYHPNCQHYLVPTSAEAIYFEEGWKG